MPHRPTSVAWDSSLFGAFEPAILIKLAYESINQSEEDYSDQSNKCYCETTMSVTTQVGRMAGSPNSQGTL